MTDEAFRHYEATYKWEGDDGRLECSSKSKQAANPHEGVLQVYKVTIVHVFILVIATNICCYRN
jgi:hypothetical protein